MWKNAILVLLLLGISAGLTFWMRDFDTATLMLSFLLSGVLYQRLNEPEQKKWLFLGGLALTLVVSGLLYTADSLVFPHSVRRPHSYGEAYINCSFWVFVGLFLAAWSSERQKARMNSLL